VITAALAAVLRRGLGGAVVGFQRQASDGVGCMVARRVAVHHQAPEMESLKTVTFQNQL